MQRPFSDLIQQLAAKGLNHTGVVSAEVYDDSARPDQHSAQLAPYAESVLVVASAGPSLWRAMLADFQLNPAHLSGEAHPLDAFVRRSIAGADVCLEGLEHRWVFADERSEVQLDFRTLAVQSGIGAPSRLGIAISPTWGPWMGLRAACFVGTVLEPSVPPASPCDDCEAPCIPACVGDAFVGGRWDVGRCAAVHVETTLCADTCAARVACPVGAGERYPELQRKYHYDRPEGRKLLAEALGIEDDRYLGIGPLWGGWSS